MLDINGTNKLILWLNQRRRNNMVNIIIPYYNDKEGIREALESLKNQTKKMFIITIVDDNSPEDIQENGREKEKLKMCGPALRAISFMRKT